jgi:hypothetical protein
MSPDLSIVQPSSTRAVPNYLRSSALGLLLLPWSSPMPAMLHLPPAHHETSKHDSPTRNKIKVVEPPKCPRFEFKPHQVNDSSQSIQGIDHLVSQSPLWWVYWQQNAQSLKFESKTPWSITRRLEKPRKAQEGHLEERKAVRTTKGMKSGKPRKGATKSS